MAENKEYIPHPQQPGQPYPGQPYPQPGQPYPGQPQPYPEPHAEPWRAARKDDIPDEPPKDEKIGDGFLSIVPRVLRLRDALFFEIREDRTTYGTIGQMAFVALSCFMIYGFIMGTYNHFPLQSIASAVKLPFIFLISLLVCLPALYLIGIMLNLRMYFRQIAGVFVMGVCATSLVAVCMAPIAAFCLVTVKGEMRYNIIQVVNILILGISGLVGVRYVLRGSRFMAKKIEKETGIQPKSRQVLWLWMFVYALVGIQLAWELRPYMGVENMPFEIRRAYTTDFYSNTIRTIGEIFRIVPTPLQSARTRHAAAERAIASDEAKLDKLNEKITALEKQIAATGDELTNAELENLKLQKKELLEAIEKQRKTREMLEQQYNLKPGESGD